MPFVQMHGADYLNDQEVSAMFIRFGKVLSLRHMSLGGIEVELETEAQCKQAVETLDDSLIEADRKIRLQRAVWDQAKRANPTERTLPPVGMCRSLICFFSQPIICNSKIQTYHSCVYHCATAHWNSSD
jgi:hypothetical protein